MDALNILVDENFDLLQILDLGGIVRLNIMLDNIFCVSEAVFQALHIWIFKKYQEGPPKSVGEHITVNYTIYELQFPSSGREQAAN